MTHALVVLASIKVWTESNLLPTPWSKAKIAFWGAVTRSSQSPRPTTRMSRYASVWGPATQGRTATTIIVKLASVLTHSITKSVSIQREILEWKLRLDNTNLILWRISSLIRKLFMRTQPVILSRAASMESMGLSLPMGRQGPVRHIQFKVRLWALIKSHLKEEFCRDHLSKSLSTSTQTPTPNLLYEAHFLKFTTSR